MATHSSIPAWRIPWTEKAGGLQYMGCKESDMTEQLNHHCYICVCVCIYVYVKMYVCICVYIYMYIYAYISESLSYTPETNTTL